MSIKFIGLRGVEEEDTGEGRKSSLLVEKDKLVVIGNLPHSYEFVPDSYKDACDLVDWLREWMDNREDSIRSRVERFTLPELVKEEEEEKLHSVSQASLVEEEVAEETRVLGKSLDEILRGEEKDT